MFVLGGNLLKTLMTLSLHHYDFECRSISERQGFLYKHNFLVSTCKDEHQEIELSFQKAGILLKVCEGARILADSDIITEEDMIEVCDLAKTLSKAVSTAYGVSKDWKHTVLSENSNQIKEGTRK